MSTSIRLIALISATLFASSALAEKVAPPNDPPPPAAAATMDAVVAPYLAMQDALARDTTDGVADAAKALAAAAGQLDGAALTGQDAKMADLPTKLKAGADAVAAAAAKDLASARAAFKTLSMPMGLWATLTKPAGIDVVYCSMTKGGWLQKTGAIRNPYHGSEMLACGEVVSGPGMAAK